MMFTSYCNGPKFSSLSVLTLIRPSSVPMKRIVASGLGYGLLPFSGIHEEIAAGKLSAALLPWIRADRVLALPRGRPASRATREVFTGLRQVCQDLIQEGKILIAKPGRTSR
jgi:LysR family nitrogen assimilation transcriptional regulator